MSNKNIMSSSSAVVAGLADAAYQQIKKGLKFDYHLEASITATIDSSLGVYRVKYQDATFNVKSENNTKYQKGDRVLVLIPNGDMNSKEKRITGMVSRDLTNYGGKSNKDELSYEKIGTNLHRPKDPSHIYQVSSYKIYDAKEYTSGVLAIPLADVNEQFTYITDATHLQLKFKLKTSIPTEQKKAAFGIELKLKFKPREDVSKLNNEPQEYYKTYRLEPYSLVGSNVYRLPNYMEQNYIFNLKDHAKDFVAIEQAYIYVSNYFYKELNRPNDIFIRDLEIIALNALSKDKIEEEYRLILSAPKGQYFSQAEEGREESLPLQAKIYLNGEESPTLTKTAKFYWFKEDLTINEKSVRYLNYGGNGWLCDNKFEIKADKENKQVYIWETGGPSYTVSEHIILSKKRAIKCVAVVDSSLILSSSIVIHKKHGIWDLSMSSSEGAVLTDNLNTTLTCTVQEPEDENERPDGNDFFEYAWQKPDENNNLSVCSNIDKKQPNILKVSGSEVFSNQIYKCGVMWHRISKDKDGKDIDDAKYVGTAEVELFNYDRNPEYSLHIVNGHQFFKYDANNLSPTQPISGRTPQKILPLTFEIRNRKGQKVENANVSGIIWKVPFKDSFISPVRNYYVNENKDLVEIEGDIEGDQRFFRYVHKLAFDIQPEYKINYSNNQIFLSVTFQPEDKKRKPIVMGTYTNLIFTKDGALGNNNIGGTCWIENLSADEQRYLEIDNTSADSEGKVSLVYGNGDFKVKARYYPNNDKVVVENNGNKWISLARNSECSNLLIKNSKSEGQEVEAAYFNFNQNVIKNQNQVWFDGNTLYPFANFIQLNLKLNGKSCYSVMPVVATKYNYGNNGIKKSDAWKIQLQRNTGFVSVQYDSKGENPLYDSDYPFEIDVIKKDKVMNNDSLLRVEWKCYGDLEIVSSKKNKCTIKPKAKYGGYGYANYVYAQVWYDKTFLGGILIPVYFYINKSDIISYDNWTGNGITVDPEKEEILTPQAGSGSQSEELTFTGVVMGTKQFAEKDKNGNTISTKTDSGLLGYCEGVQTIFLDASTGNTTLGVENQGQLIIDYIKDKAELVSKDYKKKTDKEKGSGMLIDLSEPSIVFGNGKFSADETGVFIKGLDYKIDSATTVMVPDDWKKQEKSLLTIMTEMQNTIKTLEQKVKNLESKIK